MANKYLINLTIIDGHFVKCRGDGRVDWSNTHIYSVEQMEIILKSKTEFNVVPLSSQINEGYKEQVMCKVPIPVNPDPVF